MGGTFISFVPSRTGVNKLFLKDQKTKMLVFFWPSIPVVTIESSHCDTEAATENVYASERGYVPLKQYSPN